MPENPFLPPDEVEAVREDESPSVSSERAAYNVVADTVIGVNVPMERQ